MKMPALKNQRHELYAKGIARGLTSDAAYVEAGYKRSRGNASTLKAKQNVRERISELEQETRQAVVEHFIITQQYLVDALIENVEISLGRRPVKIGADGVLTYVFRPEAVNTAIKMAASEVGLFKDKAEITHKMDFDDLSDDELLLKLRDETDALIRERAARAARENGDSAPKIPKPFSSAFTTRAETLLLENKQPEERESGGDELAPRWRSGRTGTK